MPKLLTLGRGDIALLSAYVQNLSCPLFHAWILVGAGHCLTERTAEDDGKRVSGPGIVDLDVHGHGPKINIHKIHKLRHQLGQELRVDLKVSQKHLTTSLCCSRMRITILSDHGFHSLYKVMPLVTDYTYFAQLACCNF